MSKQSSNKSIGPIGFFIVGLTLLFIGLKLGGVIDWWWIWVVSPLWISFCLCVILYLIFFIIGFIVTLIYIYFMGDAD